MGPGALLLPVAMFLASFAWSFVFVSLPFHVQAISTLDPASTLRWAGWILGITSVVTVVTAPVWGRLAGRGNPKSYYLAVEMLQGVGFFGMAAARTLGELFASRFFLGFAGASSTFAFMLVGRAADPAEVRRGVAAVQSAMTVGQMLGPLAGAMVAARVGFRPSFVVGGGILFLCAAVVKWGVTIPPDVRPPGAGGRPVRLPDVATACAIVLAGSSQMFFLTAVLPQVLPGLGVGAAGIVETGGYVVFVSAVAAAGGAFLTPHLARAVPERPLMAGLLVASSAWLALLGVAGSVFSFAALRFLQVLCAAPVFPLVVARIAHQAGGAAIGIVNSARIGAAFVGPVLATTILASASPAVVYGVLASLAVACLPLVLRRPPRGS